jgi:hypothetical protein
MTDFMPELDEETQPTEAVAEGADETALSNVPQDDLANVMIRRAQQRSALVGALQDHTIEERAWLLRDALRDLGALNTTMGQALLQLLWQVYKDGLWAVAIDDVQYENFRDWVNAEIEPYFGGSNSNGSALLWDMVRVVESTLVYLLAAPVRVEVEGTTTVVTPELLISQPEMVKKLKGTRGHFIGPDTDKKHRAQRVEIIQDILSKPFSQIQQRWSKKRKPVITLPYQMVNGPSHNTIEVDLEGGEVALVFKLGAEQYELLLSLLGDAAKEI